MRNAILALLLFGMLAAHANPAAFYEGLTMARLRGNAVGPAEPWTPADLTGLALWLDASDASTLWADTNATTAATNNGLVARWDDLSGNNYHVTQTNSARQPTLTTNGLVFSQTGSHKFLRNTSISRPQQSTVGGVWRGDGGASSVFFDSAVSTVAQGIYRDSTKIIIEAGSGLNGPLMATGVYHIVSGTWNGTNSVIALNGSPTTGNTGTNAPTGVTVGSNRQGNFAANGPITEVVYFTTASAADRVKLEGYLADKWWRQKELAVPLPTNHLYYAAPPTK
jgi:hypothetical protein